MITNKEIIIKRENVLKRDFSITIIDKKWVGDITYTNTLKDGLVISDFHHALNTKKIVGYAFSCSMTIDLISEVL